MPKHSSHILELARKGAEARYRELLDEMKMLTISFPHLRDAIDRDELPVNFILRRGRDKAKARPLLRRHIDVVACQQRRGGRSVWRRNGGGRSRRPQSRADSLPEDCSQELIDGT